MLVETLRLVAASHQMQTRCLPSFVHIPDEIALAFADVYFHVEAMTRQGVLSQEQQMGLARLSALFNEMSQDEAVWTMDALAHLECWKEVRAQASNMLAFLGQAGGDPDLFWMRFIQDNRN